MSNHSQRNRSVVPHPDGWANQRDGAQRASSVHPTQKEAIARAKEMLQNEGGGEVRIHNRKGRIRDSDTVPPGNDPYPPKDTKH